MILGRLDPKIIVIKGDSKRRNRIIKLKVSPYHAYVRFANSGVGVRREKDVLVAPVRKAK